MSTLKRKAGPQAGADSKKPKQNTSIMSFFGAQGGAKAGGSNARGTASAAALESAPLRFNKEKWLAGLTEEQRQLLSLEINTMHDSWLAVLKDEIVTKEFLELKRFLARETAAGKKWFPPKEDVYSWTRHTPFNTVKVVIIGQDPYHNVNQAHGLAFSVRPPTPTPPSLRNMYICLRNDYPAFAAPPNNGGLLTPWAERGVLMLNTCLTVRAHDANSHANRGWERFTQKAIDLVAARRARGVVFIAWGTPAGKRVQRVDTQRHLVLRSVHPSPLSAAKGFFNCGHFRKANEWLLERYGASGEIDWALTQGTSTLEHNGTGPAAGVDGQPAAEVVGDDAKSEADAAAQAVETAVQADEAAAGVKAEEADEETLEGKAKLEDITNVKSKGDEGDNTKADTAAAGQENSKPEVVA